MVTQDKQSDLTNTASPVQSSALPASPVAPSHGFAEKAGRWANSNRNFFRSVPGELMFRNALNSMVAWIPTVTSFTATYAMWDGYEKFAEKNPKSLLTKIGKPLLGKEFPVGRATTFIFFGWFTYRASSKLWNRAYDRLFAAPTPEAATDVVRAMPHNFVQDAKEIVPGGIAEVIPGSLALASIPMAFLNQDTWRTPSKAWEKLHGKGALGDFATARKGWLNNTLATGVAYTAFLEICDHIYPAVTHGKDYGNFYRNLQGLPPREHIPDDQKKYGFFTNEGVGRILFRNAPAVLIGFAAYFNPICGQRASYAKFGRPTGLGKNISETAKNWGRDYAAWALPFTYYTVISQVYKDNYDKLFDKLEKHAAEHHHPAARDDSKRFRTLVDNSRTAAPAHL